MEANQTLHDVCPFPGLVGLHYARCVTITGMPNFQGQNLFNMRFIRTKISGPRQEIMLREVLQELSTTCTAFTV